MLVAQARYVPLPQCADVRTLDRAADLSFCDKLSTGLVGVSRPNESTRERLATFNYKKQGKSLQRLYKFYGSFVDRKGLKNP